MTDLVKQWDEYVESMGSVMGKVEHMAQQMADSIDALAAKLAEVEADRDKWYKRAMEMVAERNDARAALPAAYRLGLMDAADEVGEIPCKIGETKHYWKCQDAIHALVQTGEKEISNLDFGDSGLCPFRSKKGITPTAAELMARIQTGETDNGMA